MITAATSSTMEQKLHCIERELKYRRKVYPRWVADGRMTEQQARTQISIMEEIAEDYRALAQDERLL